MKSVLPSLRERKRYLMYRVISGRPLTYLSIKTSLIDGVKRFIGEFGVGGAGLVLLNEHYSAQQQTGILQVNHQYLDKIRASLCGISSMEDVPVIVKSVQASGMINKLVCAIKGS